MASFRLYNTTLCPDVWDEYQHLDPRVRVNLLRLAYDFYKKTKFTAPITDIYLMGSIANFNWTPDSDLDVHIMVDYNALEMPPETTNKMVKTVGAQWNAEHNIVMRGHKVEMNFQNVSEVKPHVTGVYSLIKDIWIRKPVLQMPHLDTQSIKVQYDSMKKYVESAMNSGNQETMKSVKEYLDAYRQYGLDTNGELSQQNIVFKILRAKGIIKKLKDMITAAYDQEMSVRENEIRRKPYPSNARFGLGAIGSNDDIQFKEFPRDTFDNQVHGQGQNPYGRRRFRYFNGVVEWSDCQRPDAEQIQLVNNYLNHRGLAVTKHTSIYDNLEEKKDKKKLNSKFPLPYQIRTDDHGKLRLNLLTLQNLQSLRDKADRSYKFCRDNENPLGAKKALQDYWYFDAEIKRRKAYIDGPVEEGYGSGIPEKDRLKIKNQDGSTRRWQIRSKDAPQTPKLPTSNET